MSVAYPKLVENLIEQLSKLPGIGRRSAERMVFWFLNEPPETAQEFSSSITRLKEGLKCCAICNNLSDAETCSVCRDEARNKSVVCVVENPKDVIAIEKTGSFKGLYHVLLGSISPSEGRGPDDLKIDELKRRIENEGVQEIVLATDADTDGEMTALHLTKELRPTGVKISRIGVGIPMGSSIEFADLSTLTMSLNSRREIP